MTAPVRGRERALIFSAPMIRALLAGTKTQTRRILKPQPVTVVDGRVAYYPHPNRPGYSRRHRLPEIGDCIWVRETWQAWTELDATSADALPPEMRERINYPADGNVWDARKRSPIHMPRWASRLTLTVTDVRVECLAEISEADALAEGLHPLDHELLSYSGKWDKNGLVSSQEIRTRRPAFARLWNSIHGPDAWSANPWVAALSFRVDRRNIDATSKEDER